jgi:hypothetical protein
VAELLELEELLELAVGKLGDLAELEDDELGVLGEELGMLEALGELDELEGLGMLGMLLEDEELDDVWHPTRTAADIPNTKMVRKGPEPCRVMSEPWVIVGRLVKLDFCDLLKVIFNDIAINSLPPSGWLKRPEIAGQERD